MTTITVRKLNHRGEPLLHYTGELVERGPTWICLQARFSRPDVDAGYVVFRRGDRMTEWFYTDRWYNIFRLEDVDSRRLKGWYCNITRPARFTDNTVAADDLALDLFVDPSGQIRVLDEDEFEALDIPPRDRRSALAAVEALKTAVRQRLPPFDELDRSPP